MEGGGGPGEICLTANGNRPAEGKDWVIKESKGVTKLPSQVEGLDFGLDRAKMHLLL